MSLKELRQEAKNRGLKGYSSMNLEQVQQFLRGEEELKYRKNQKSIGIQTEWIECQDCA